MLCVNLVEMGHMVLEKKSILKNSPVDNVSYLPLEKFEPSPMDTSLIEIGKVVFVGRN